MTFLSGISSTSSLSALAKPFPKTSSTSPARAACCFAGLAMPTFSAAKAQMPIKNMRASQTGRAITPPLQIQFTSPNSIKTSISSRRGLSNLILLSTPLRHDVDVRSDLHLFEQLDDVRVVHAKTAVRDGAADRAGPVGPVNPVQGIAE